MSAWVLIPVGAAAAALAGLYLLCRAASEPLFDEQFRDITPPPRMPYAFVREPTPMLVNAAGSPTVWELGEFIVTPSGVRIPLGWFRDEQDLDAWLGMLEEIDAR